MLKSPTTWKRIRLHLEGPSFWGGGAKGGFQENIDTAVQSEVPGVYHGDGLYPASLTKPPQFLLYSCRTLLGVCNRADSRPLKYKKPVEVLRQEFALHFWKMKVRHSFFVFFRKEYHFREKPKPVAIWDGSKYVRGEKHNAHYKH
jgi:hypothetical protein